MKKVLAILLALSVLALSACAAKQVSSDTQEKPGEEVTDPVGRIADTARAGSKAH